MARKNYHHGNLREALLNAALRQLSKTGDARISLRGLARTVGVSPNAAYRHFADKDSLVAALAAHGFRSMAAAQGKAVSAHKEPMQRHRAAGRTYVKFARENRALFRLMFGRHFPASKELEDASNFAFEALKAGASAAFGLPPGDPRVLTAAVRAWSMAHGLSQLILDGQLDGYEGDLDELIDGVLQPPQR